MTATIFTLFKANIQRWRPSAATTKEGDLVDVDLDVDLVDVDLEVDLVLAFPAVF